MGKKTIALMSAFIVLAALSGLAFGFPASEVYETSGRSVVLIVAAGDEGSLVGAGSIITQSGIVVTNAHVVIDKKTNKPYPKIRVYLKPEEVTGSLEKDLVRKFNARVLFFDVTLDLATLQTEDLPADAGSIKLSSPKDIKVGEEVVAIGHPEQGGLWTLTYGRISTQIADQGNVKGKDVYQTDTSMNRGNSGGPLLDKRGYLVGVNTNIARLGEGGLPITGVNFALKSAVVKTWLGKNGLNVAYGSEPMQQKPSEAAPAAPVQPAQQAQPAQPAAPVTEKKPEEAKPAPAAPAASTPAPSTAAPVVEKKPEPAKPAEQAKPAEEAKPVEKPKQAEQAKADEKPLKSDTILTPKKPYSQDDLIKQVEKEMEDIMQEMRGKIRK